MNPVSALNPLTSSNPYQKVLEYLFIHFMRQLKSARLRIQFPSGRSITIGSDSASSQELKIEDSRFFKYVFLRGDVGFGEAYVEGFWSSPDLSGLLLLLAKNKTEVKRLHRGFSYLARFNNRLYHLTRRNSLEQSKHNIQEHYDLSNEFYKNLLDPTMTYSSARFHSKSESLEQAQFNKIDRMLDLAEVQAGSSILEIGTGWGSLALRAAQRGCTVKTITLSEEQYDFSKKRFIEAGVADQINLCLQDYRLLDGQYDAVLSCEMIEAVGKEYLADYFRIIKQSLKPGARAVIQSITIPDDRYKQYSRGCDWIQKYIFPGGHLPSIEAIRAHVDSLGKWAVFSIDSFGQDYAETLRRWANRFNSNKPQIQQLGFNAAFCRKWNYYLSYCEAGFDAGLIDVNHFVIK